MHTPLPWKAFLSWSGRPRIYAGEHRIGQCPIHVNGKKEGIANAEFIVRACNSHANLLEALETLVKCHEDGGFVQPDDDVIITAKQAIAKAKGE